MGPLGMRYAEENGFWEVSVYPTPVELVGGADDGEVVAPGFTLDLEQLRALFDPHRRPAAGTPSGCRMGRGRMCSWKARTRAGRSFSRSWRYAPEDEEPGLKLDTTRRQRLRE